MKFIVWGPMPRTPHGILGVLKSARAGERKVAAIINEDMSPRRPRGLPPSPKPFTLELYVPVLVGQDKILKFTTEEAAMQAAVRALEDFVKDCL